MNNHDNNNYASQFYVFVVCFIRSKEKATTLHVFFLLREEGREYKKNGGISKSFGERGCYCFFGL